MRRLVLVVAVFVISTLTQKLAQWRTIVPRGVVSIGLGQMETDLQDPAIAYINTGQAFFRPPTRANLGRRGSTRIKA